MAAISTFNPIPPATLLSVQPWMDSKGVESADFWIVEAKFRVSLNHKTMNEFNDLSLTLTARIVLGKKAMQKPLSEAEFGEYVSKSTEGARVFLCGGPGDENPPDRNPEFNDWYTSKGDILVYLDYRGTGSSVEICNSAGVVNRECHHFMRLLRPQDDPSNMDIQLTSGEAIRMSRFLTLFRQDNIVRDLEAIRSCLQDTQPWRIFGQSYGGWISLSYLSMYPKSLKDAIITAGLPPNRTADETYQTLFNVVIARNDEYYGLYPDDIERVKLIVLFLVSTPPHTASGYLLPTTGTLSAQRFLCLGRNLGSRARWAELHDLIWTMWMDVTVLGLFRPSTLVMYEKVETWRFDKRPLYAVLHEAMYATSGYFTNWSAERVAAKLPQFRWARRDSGGREWKQTLVDMCCLGDDTDKIYFSGEMIYPFFFSTHRALRPLWSVANALANGTWTADLYDRSLEWNTVPVQAISYQSDMHVNPTLSQETANHVKGIRHQVLDTLTHNSTTYQLEHGSIRAAGAATALVDHLTKF
ncbi:proline iminopeptidase [Seiridium cupressi]